MKNKIFFGRAFLFLTVAATLFLSCSKEDAKPSTPTIEVIHLGIDDGVTDNIFFLGQEGHFEVNINAPGRIEKIDLEIRQITGYGNFTITKTYTAGYVGKKEVLGFEDYPIIPEGEGIGLYAFSLKITDQKGQVASIDDNITVAVSDGSIPPHQHDTP